jgi:hypothetical protein
VAAAAVVAADAYFSAQDGYLSKGPDYDGVGYMVYGRTAYELLLGLHPHAALTEVTQTIAPGWVATLAMHYLVLGPGPWQAFSVRFWAVGLLLTLVYWVVRNRSSATIAIAATAVTAVLPAISAGVRSSSLEYFTGSANYSENWGLDDLRPDLLGVALLLWSVATLAERNDAPTRSTYVVSALFAVAAILVKPSTSPLLALVWATALAVTWFRNRRTRDTTINTVVAAALAGILLLPYAIFARGIVNVVQYLYETAVIYRGVYGTNDTVVDRFGYFVARLPTDLGPIEAWIVAAGALVVTVMLVRGKLTGAELLYALVFCLLYVTFALATARNAHLPLWTWLALWVYVLAGAARLTRRYFTANPFPRSALLGTVAVYTLAVYCLGAIALAAWPANERSSHAQLLAATAGVAHELATHISSRDCFAFAPGPGWPGSIQFAIMGRDGRAPASTTTDIDTSHPVADYVETAKKCAAVLTYEEDITQVARVFYAPPPYQPYLRAVADWVKQPNSGYRLDRTWPLFDIGPDTEHVLGGFQGVDLTVELFLRSGGTTSG